MTDAELHNAIRGRFKTEVAEVRGLTTIYDNDPSDPPADGSTWCRFSIRRAETRRITCGVNEYRRSGRAFAQLFCGVGRGDGDLLELADAVATAFRSVTAGGVRYGTPTIRPIGLSDEQYQINVECPFECDSQDE